MPVITIRLDHDGSVLSVHNIPENCTLRIQAYLDAQEDSLWPVKHDEYGNPYETVLFGSDGKQIIES